MLFPDFPAFSAVNKDAIAVFNSLNGKFFSGLVLNAIPFLEVYAYQRG